MFVGQKIYPQVAAGVPGPAPVGGLNDFDPIAQMGDQFMLDCMNFYPDNSDVTVRPGYRVLQSNIGFPVVNIFSHITKAGEYQTFAATIEGIYEVDDPENPVKAMSLSGGLANAVNFSNTDNAYTLVWNGIDPLMYYDGTDWDEFIEVGSPANVGEISGINPATISYVFVYKARLWFIKRNTMEMFFMPLDAMGGEASPMPIGGNFNHGGHLVALAGWSVNTGAGLAARLLAVTSEGEVATFSGSDPSDADNWGLDSVFYISPPVGPYAYAKLGGDLVILTRRGLIPVSSMMSGVPSEVMFANALTKRISNAIKRLTLNWKTADFPLQVFNHAEAVWLTITVYDQLLAKPVQYVMNIITGAWGRFDYPCRTMATYNGVTYMGTQDGRVLVITPESFLDGVDSDGENGEPIEAKFMSAYTYLDQPTVIKHAKFIRPVVHSRVKPAVAMRVLADFRREDFDPYVQPPIPLNDPLWDQALWDQAKWPGNDDVHTPWISANVLGYAFAYQMKVSTSIELRMSAVEWVHEGGGLI